MIVQIAHPNQLRKVNYHKMHFINDVQKSSDGSHEAIITASGAKYLRMPNGMLRRVKNELAPKSN